MSVTYIPPRQTKRWSGLYPGNYYGVLWKTFNVDLDKSEGNVSLSRRFERIEDSTEHTGTGFDNQVSAFLRTNSDCTDRYWALFNGGRLAKTDSTTPENATVPSDDWDSDALASTPTTCRDMTIHGNDSRNDSGRNKLFVTLDSGDIAVLNDTGNSAWTASWWETKQVQNPLTPDGNGATLFRPIEYFPYTKITIVGSGSLIHTVSRPSDTQNDTFTYGRLVLPKDLSARHIFHTPTRAWILCDNRYGGEGGIVEWDGFSSSYIQIHRAYGTSALSGVNYNGVPIVLNSKGVFLEYAGTSFQPMIRNGQQVAFPMIDDMGASLVTGSDTAIAVSVFPRGITAGEDGLIYINAAESNITSQRYGAGVWCLNPMNGRLYSKYSLGRWGDSVDYGHQDLQAPGVLSWIPSGVSTRNLIAGGIINTTATAGNQTGIWLLEAPTSTTLTRGHFITQYISSDDIKDFWDTLWLRFRRLMTTGSSIIVKGRGVRSLVLANRRPLSATITWTTTTTFTLTLASADDSLSVGDEVEVLNGVNAGYLAHITTITGAHGALQTITIDETVTTGSSTSTARFERWKKLGTMTSTSVYEQFMNVGIDSSFMQFKVELRGLANEMEFTELISNHESSLKVKK